MVENTPNINNPNLVKLKYGTTSDEQRVALIRLVVQMKVHVRDAALKIGMKYSTAKSILKLYENTGRIKKMYCSDGLSSIRKRKKAVRQIKNS